MKAELWFYKGPGKLFDKLIRGWTCSIYSHVELVIGGMSYSADAWEGQVRSKGIGAFTRENWDVVEIEFTKSYSWLGQQLGKKYDWLGILGFMLFKVQDPSRWYCSEFCACAVGINADRISPQQLFEKTTTTGA
jgi:hypothetical protein